MQINNTYSFFIPNEYIKVLRMPAPSIPQCILLWNIL